MMIYQIFCFKLAYRSNKRDTLFVFTILIKIYVCLKVVGAWCLGKPKKKTKTVITQQKYEDIYT